jgi:TolB-like protein/Tfp pilus assembly protein PilF
VPVTPELAQPDPPPGREASRRATPSALRRLVYVVVAIAAVVAVLVFALPRTSSGLRSEFPATAALEPPTTRADVAAMTLAVLPFHTSSTDEAASLLAQGVTDLMRNRLAALEDLTVVASGSTSGLTDSRANLRSIGEKLNAQVLLTGTANSDGQRLHLAVQLVDARSGERLWSGIFDRPLAEVALIREEVFRQVAGALHVPVERAAGNAAASNNISLDAYLLYIRGQRLLARSTAIDAQAAVELFRRATILDPGFARAYLGLGQALITSDDQTFANGRSAGLAAGRPRTSEVDAQAAKAIERALDLNPALGEAWIERARLASDSAEAERLFRKGLALAPNYSEGFAHYASFLFRESRTGEAIETISRASQIDPLTPGPYQLHAFLLMVARSDVAGHDRLLRKALAINPALPSVLRQLAQSRWEYSGEFADAAQLIEQAIAADPHSALSRALARDIYLDLGDRAAAKAVLGDSMTPDSSMEIAQFDGDRKRAAALLTDVSPDSWREATGSHAPLAEAIRDGAIATGRLDRAVRLLGSMQAAAAKSTPMWTRGFSLVYAHTLILTGEIERGRQLAESILALVDTHGVGRTENWFSRERAAAYAVLGENDRAIEQLEISVRTGKLYRWWYLAGHDPLFERLRSNPRFQAINGQAQRHLQRQRALLEELRRKGTVPRRANQDPG